MVILSFDHLIPQYILIPKTGTTTLIHMMNSCFSGHVCPSQPVKYNKIIHDHFTAKPNIPIIVVLRDPIKRFQSFLNFRQAFPFKRPDWGKLPFKTNVSILVDTMTDIEMLSFTPYSQMSQYITTQHVTFKCSVLEMYEYITTEMQFKNCSKLVTLNSVPYTYGYFKPSQYERIRRVFSSDEKLWKTHCH